MQENKCLESEKAIALFMARDKFNLLVQSKK